MRFEFPWWLRINYTWLLCGAVAFSAASLLAVDLFDAGPGWLRLLIGILALLIFGAIYSGLAVVGVLLYPRSVVLGEVTVVISTRKGEARLAWADIARVETVPSVRAITQARLHTSAGTFSLPRASGDACAAAIAARLELASHGAKPADEHAPRD